MKTKKQMQAEIDKLTKQRDGLVDALIAATKGPLVQPVIIQQPYQVYPDRGWFPRYPNWWETGITWTATSMSVVDECQLTIASPPITLFPQG